MVTCGTGKFVCGGEGGVSGRGEDGGERTYGAGPALAGRGVDDVAEDLLVEA